METGSRIVKDGREFDKYFPKAVFSEVTVKKNADLSHTMEFIPDVVRKTQWQTKRIAPLLKGRTLQETLIKVFDFAHDYINYHIDDKGKEQIRSPRRSWAERKRGIDCDDYTVFICSILANLGIPVTMRVAKYLEANGFQHIYPIVPTENGKYTTMDPVIHIFDFEKTPILEKIDKKMELNFLDGVDDDEQNFDEDNVENPMYGVGELGQGIFSKIGEKIKDVAKDISIKNVVNVVNKINPATILLRNGLLAGMKLNIFKVAGNMRWSYLTNAQAQQKGILMDRFAKIVSVRKKLEDIFFAAGGKVENLKKAILTGKGNKDKNVPLSGLDGLGYVDEYALSSYSSSTPMETLLGEIYGEEGMGQLGDPATATALAAASGALASIAALIKGIGSLFPSGKAPANEAGEEGSANDTVLFNADGSSPEFPSVPIPTSSTGSNALTKLLDHANKKTTTTSTTSVAAKPTTSSAINKSTVAMNQLVAPSALAPATLPSSQPSAAILKPSVAPSLAPQPTTTPNSAEGFWDKNKKWLQPTVIGIGVLGILFIGAKLLNKSAAKEPLKGLEGTPRKVTRSVGRPKGSKNKTSKVALRKKALM